MPTVSVYMSEDDYDYYRGLEKKGRVLHWAFEQHRKVREKSSDAEEGDFQPPEEPKALAESDHDDMYANLVYEEATKIVWNTVTQEQEDGGPELIKELIKRGQV